MPADGGDLPEYIDETHQRIAEFASEFLDDDERDDFVDGLLERHGYQRVSKWAAPDPGGGAPGGRKPLVKPRATGGQGGGQGGGQRRQGGYFGGRQR